MTGFATNAHAEFLEDLCAKPDLCRAEDCGATLKPSEFHGSSTRLHARSCFVSAELGLSPRAQRAVPLRGEFSGPKKFCVG